MFGLKSLRKAVADAERYRHAYNDAMLLLAASYGERDALRAELARWKPDRDAQGRFTHTAAVMPEIAGRDCSFIERDGNDTARTS